MSTPMQQQYRKLKQEYSDCILLFRLGDFYEGFEEDAEILAKVLGITLTARKNKDEKIPMAGIPYHALDQYLPKLVHAGHKVALAEQLEDAVPGKLVKRDVVKIISSGTIIDEKILKSGANNYIASFYWDKQQRTWGLAYADASTGEFKLGEFSGSDNVLPYNLINELYKLRVAELIIPEDILKQVRINFSREVLNRKSIREFNYKKSMRLLLEHFKLSNLKGFGVEKYPAGITAAGVLLEYLKYTQKTTLSHLDKLLAITNDEYMQLDFSTIRSLELLHPQRDYQEGIALHDVINHCETSMGQRELHSRLLRPLLDRKQIEARLERVEALTRSKQTLNQIKSALKKIKDIERIGARLATKSANARDLVYLKNSTKEALAVDDLLKQTEILTDLHISDELSTEIKALINLIEKTILEEPAVSVTEGGMIKTGNDVELDELINIKTNAAEYLKNLEREQIKQTGITSLKVKHNKVFGYFIEVSKSNLDKVPDNYIRKQTLVNAERFITAELKEWEEKIFNAEDKIAQLEYEIFQQTREKVVAKLSSIKEHAKIIAEIDVNVNFASLAIENDWVKPVFVANDKDMQIIDGRHPVVEQDKNIDFIPNDAAFSKQNQQIIILTGPNMSGKSTYIRQIALITLLAQIGSFVPAKSAQLHIVDRIFTRVGAADNLSSGESTFMVEMNETANILNNANENSLIILDEIGRGTSTYDGLSLAWSVIEFIAQKIKAKTLFATHYHELMELEEVFAEVKNYHVDVKETDGKVLFMHKIVRGGTDQSYGIHVAELAGVPDQVVKRAEQLLQSFESETEANRTIKTPTPMKQLPLDIRLEDPIREKLKATDLNSMTPLEALNYLQKIKDEIE